MTEYGEMLIIDAKLVETFLKGRESEIQYAPIVIFFGFQMLHEIVS